jgi:hypothetical protein
MLHPNFDFGSKMRLTQWIILTALIAFLPLLASVQAKNKPITEPGMRHKLTGFPPPS